MCSHEQYYIKVNSNKSQTDVCATCGKNITLADWKDNPAKSKVEKPLAKVLDFVAFKKRRDAEKLVKKGDKNGTQG